MVTLVGTQTNFANAIKELIELDRDAKEAYQAAIDRLNSQLYKEKLTSFMEDHERHIKELSGLLTKHLEEPPQEASVKQWLTKGKVVIANIIGDSAILKAMASNEVDTNSAYQRINERQDIWEDAKSILKKGWLDEKRHLEWLKSPPHA